MRCATVNKEKKCALLSLNVDLTLPATHPVVVRVSIGCCSTPTQFKKETFIITIYSTKKYATIAKLRFSEKNGFEKF